MGSNYRRITLIDTTTWELDESSPKQSARFVDLEKAFDHVPLSMWEELWESEVFFV